MRYRIQLARKAQKFLTAQSVKIQRQIGDAVDALEINPRPHGHKQLKGHKDLYRVRSGDYRIIYTIKDDQLLVLVIQIGSRKDVYRAF